MELVSYRLAHVEADLEFVLPCHCQLFCYSSSYFVTFLSTNSVVHIMNRAVKFFSKLNAIFNFFFLNNTIFIQSQ